jgi:hypothetical protein
LGGGLTPSYLKKLLCYGMLHSVSNFDGLFGTLMGQYRLRVFENRVLRRIIGLKRKRQEVGEKYITRRCTICTLRQILLGWWTQRKMSGGRGHESRVEEMRNKYIFIWKTESKRSLGRSRHKWNDNIKMHHKNRIWTIVTGFIFLL